MKHRYTIVREEPENESGPVLASIVVRAREVVVETNSRSHADVLRGRLEEICKAIRTFTKREEQTPLLFSKESPPLPGRKIPQSSLKYSYQLLRGQLVLQVRVVDGRRHHAGDTESGFHQ